MLLDREAQLADTDRLTKPDWRVATSMNDDAHQEKS